MVVEDSVHDQYLFSITLHFINFEQPQRTVCVAYFPYGTEDSVRAFLLHVEYLYAMLSLEREDNFHHGVGYPHRQPTGLS